jgi:SAM-dependent methyltransferase
MSTRRSWEDEARDWIAWARTPGHDVFPFFAPAFFEEMVPAPNGLTVEIGCGEGRVARELAARGHRVVGIDRSQTLIRAARDADRRSAYVNADATSLPFTAGTFGAAVAYNSLQTMQRLGDMAAAVGEAGRVLSPGATFCVCVAHPMTDLRDADTSSHRQRPYFERVRVDETVEKDGLRMTFHGWTYTLEDYARALADAGFVIERIREPLPAADEARPDLERHRREPLFMWIRARKRA